MTGKPKPERTTIATGRRELKEIIDTCDAISERRFNPFFLDVELGVETLRKYYPKWESFNDHCLDAHTLNRLAEVFLQSWHPLAELEQLTDETVNDSLTYWNALLPISERWLRKTQQESAKPHSADSNTLKDLGISGEEFDDQLIGLWNELRKTFESTQQPVDY